MLRTGKKANVDRRLKTTALKKALEVLKNFDGLTVNEVEDLASESETGNDYDEAHTDDNSKQIAEEEKESTSSHIHIYIYCQ